MFDRTTVHKLIEHTPLAVTVMGVVVFLAAAAGGLPVGDPPLSVGSTGWRIVLALLGSGLVAAGVLLMRQEKGKGPTSRDIDIDSERYGIRIERPRTMSQIASSELTIIGSYEVRPPEGMLRLFTLSTPDGAQVQPQVVVDAFDEERREWSAQLRLADPPRYSLFIVAALVGKTGAALWNYYFNVARDGKALPLDGPLPPDVVECQRIWVERV